MAIDILSEKLHNLGANCGYSEDPECRLRPEAQPEGRKPADWRPHSSKFFHL